MDCVAIAERIADAHGPFVGLESLELEPSNVQAWEQLALELAQDQEWEEVCAQPSPRPTSALITLLSARHQALLAAVPAALLSRSCSEGTTRVLRRAAAACLPRGWLHAANSGADWVPRAAARAEGTLWCLGSGLGLAATMAAVSTPARTLALTAGMEVLEPLVANALQAASQPTRLAWVEELHAAGANNSICVSDGLNEDGSPLAADVLVWELPSAGLNAQLVEQVRSVWRSLPPASAVAPLQVEVWGVVVQAGGSPPSEGSLPATCDAATERRETLRRLLRCEPELCASGDLAGFKMDALCAAMTRAQQAYPIRLEEWDAVVLAPPVRLLHWDVVDGAPPSCPAATCCM